MISRKLKTKSRDILVSKFSIEKDQSLWALNLMSNFLATSGVASQKLMHLKV